jgi:hypothetical protein
MPFTVSQIVFHDYESFVLLRGERLYIAVGKTLYVYSARKLTNPIAAYRLKCEALSANLFDNRLYIGSTCKFIIFELTPSLTEPLRYVTKIETKEDVFSIIRNGNELLVGEDDGWLEVFDISSSTIINSCCIIQSEKI